MAFAICWPETVMNKIVFFLWQELTSALMFNFSISTNIVNKRVILGIKCKFFPESVINIVIIVNS